MVSTICNITNDMGGIAEENLQDKPWDNAEIGWLSILGYEAYLINPIDNSQWEPAVNLTSGSLSISESGSYDQYTLSWASNAIHHCLNCIQPVCNKHFLNMFNRKNIDLS